MANTGFILNQWRHEMDQQRQSVERKVSQTLREWSGEARKGMEEAHAELRSTHRVIEQEVDDMKRLNRDLDRSMQAADRDMAEKARQAMLAMQAMQAKASGSR